MEGQTRTTVTAAAVVQAGIPDDYETPDLYWASVQDAAFQIMDAAGEKGRLGSQLELFAGARCYLVDEVLAVSREQTSNRVVVKVRVKPTKYTRDGIEMIRTERLDSFTQAESARLVGNTAKALIGHAARIYVRNEEMANGDGKAKVLMHIVDAGPARENRHEQ